MNRSAQRLLLVGAIACLAGLPVRATTINGSIPNGSTPAAIAGIIGAAWNEGDFDCSVVGSKVYISGHTPTPSRPIAGPCAGQGLLVLEIKGGPTSGGIHTFTLSVNCPVARATASCDVSELPYPASFRLDANTLTPLVVGNNDYTQFIIGANPGCVEPTALGRTAQVAAAVTLLGMLTFWILRRRS